MEYMTTNRSSAPLVYSSTALAATPMAMMPFWVTRRSDRWLKRLGTHWSVAIAASVRGPSRKPVWAATNSSAPSETSVKPTTAGLRFQPPRRQPRVSSSHSEALSVWPSWYCTLLSR